MLKFNPITSKLDHVENFNQGMGVWTFLGATEDAPEADPGAGNIVLDYTDGTIYLLVSYTDKNGWDFYMNFMFMYGFFSDSFSFIIELRSKSRPHVWVKLLVLDADVPVGVSAYQISCFPFGGTTYDDGEEYSTVLFEDGEDVILTMEAAFNSDYVGTLGTQDYNDVSITGGTISAITAALTEGRLQLPIKATTGDFNPPYGGEIYLNTYDKKIRMYDGEAWHTIFDYSE